jgi:hypothetical protein
VILQQVKTRGRVARDHRRGREIDSVRNDRGVFGDRLHIFGVAAPGVHAHQTNSVGAAQVAHAQRNGDPVTRLAIGDALADLGNHTRRIDARHQRQLHRPGVCPGADPGVERAVDRDSVNLDQHLARAGFRRRNLFEFHDVRRAELADHNGFQRQPPQISGAIKAVARRCGQAQAG